MPRKQYDDTQAQTSWRQVTVDDIRAPFDTALATGPFGSSISSRYFTSTGVPVIRGSNLSEHTGTRLIDDGLVFVSKEKAAEFKRSTVRKGDLIFTCWGTINQVGLIDDRARYVEYVISNKQMKFTPDPTKADSLFLYYLFSGPEFQQAIFTNSIGSSVPGFNLGALRSIQFWLPSLSEQRAIASILSALDDKIELNRRTNATLETMACAIFQSWFVDFDPVRAKAEGRETGLPAEIEALFPEGFEESELGAIPQGWRVGTLQEFATVVMGLSPAGDSYNYVGDGVPLINGPVEFGEFFPLKSKWTSKPTRLTMTGDLVICVRGSTTGRRVIADDVYCLGRGVCALRAKEGMETFLYQLISYGLNRLLSKATGSVFPNLSAPDIKGFKIMMPPDAIIHCFGNTTGVFHRQLKLNVQSSYTLTTIRNLLLPKLMSRTVCFDGGEKAIGRNTPYDK